MFIWENINYKFLKIIFRLFVGVESVVILLMYIKSFCLLYLFLIGML